VDVYPDTAVLDAFYAVWSWIILMSQMVPISLVVSSEMVKFFQSFFIETDINLFRGAPYFKRAKCNRSTIHEELGLVDYIFSDKTGTLTQNAMTFRYALLGDGQDFGSTETEIARSVAQKALEAKTGQPALKLWSSVQHRVAEEPAPRDPGCCVDCENTSCCRKCYYEPASDLSRQSESREAVGADVCEFSAAERKTLLQALWGPKRPDETEAQRLARRATLRRYLLHMALSNTVKTITETDKHTGEVVKKYQAESAEEKAMVEFAKSVGFTKDAMAASDGGPDVILVLEQNYSEDLTPTSVTRRKFLHVATFGFSSRRARVTVAEHREELIFVLL
jgi:magnesium-transporting ATPase (P-type)